MSIALLLLAAGSALAQTVPVTGDARVDRLLSDMTLAEKLLHDGREDPRLYQGQAGYFAGVPRLGIPGLRLADGPPGVLTRVPSQGETATMGVAASFDVELARLNGVVIGREARALGIDVSLQPFINIDRDLSMRRLYNTFGEDPLLTGEVEPAGFDFPRSSLAVAQPPSSPGHHISRMALTRSAQGSATGWLVFSTTIVSPSAPRKGSITKPPTAKASTSATAGSIDSLHGSMLGFVTKSSQTGRSSPCDHVPATDTFCYVTKGARMSVAKVKCGACRSDVTLPSFTMAFQPIVDIDTTDIYAYEALVRPTGGGSAADVLSQINDQNRYSFDQACRVKAIELAAQLEMDSLLSINFLPNAVYQPAACLQKTLEAANRAQFPVDHLIFEVTENEPTRDVGHLKSIFNEYKRHGMITAIDDFGAGHSGLNMLADFQPDIIKMDMALTRSIHADDVRTKIAGAIISLCKSLHIRVIAEGIETIEEAVALRALGVHLFQGYLFARPAIEQLPAVPSSVIDSVHAASESMLLGEPIQSLVRRAS
jgi:EAL domain-containing protein (putative c-di-GMP-specific phosphodiesterase class I)